MSPNLDYSRYIHAATKDFTGREWVLAAIDGWLTDDAAPRHLVLTGEPGIGKTALAARLTQIREVAAHHFCVARSPETTDALTFVRSISQQLAKHEAFAACLLAEQGVQLSVDIKVAENYGEVVGVRIESLLINTPSAEAAFNRAVLLPLRRLYSSGFTTTFTILVDALDEAVQSHGAETIVDLLAGTQDLPPLVRFILASRPDSIALRHLDHLRPLTFFLDAGSVENGRDIRRYLRRRLAEFPSVSQLLQTEQPVPNDAVESLTTASAGNFLCLVWFIRALAAGGQPSELRPTVAGGLDGVYRGFLRTRSVGKSVDRWRATQSPAWTFYPMGGTRYRYRMTEL